MPLGSVQLGQLLLGGEATYSHTIEQAVCRLLGDAIQTPIVKRRAQGDALPVIEYRLDDDEPETFLDGTTSHRVARFEFRIYSTDYGQLRPLSEEIYERLHGFGGMAWDREVLTALWSDEEDDEEDRDDGGEGCVYVRACFYEVTYLR